MTGEVQQQKRHQHKASWLLKQAEWRFAWDRRFFVQDGLRLAYRVEENGAEKKSGYLTSLQRTVGPPQSNIFRVWLREGDCWTLQAETNEQYRQWTDSITTALLRDVAGGERRDVREGIVLKKGAWLGEWRQRYLELDEYRLAYRISKENEVRNRFVIMAADASGEKGREEEMFLTTSSGERFWLKFANVDQFNDWRGVIMRNLRRAAPWNWMTLGASSYGSEYASLHLQYHASVSGSGSFVYCYGGTRTLSTRRYFEASRIFLPEVHRENVEKQLTCFHLAGEHKCFPLDVLPFEESAHAKVRPPPLFGAGLALLSSGNELLSSSAVETKSAMLTPNVECLLLVGGRGETCAIRDITVEVWWCVLKGPSLSKWQRCTYDVNVFPHRTFHTLIARNSTSAILAGGVDDRNGICADCFIIFWSDSEMQDFVTPPTVRFWGYLPEPRAFHVCVALHDKSLLILGGRGVSDGAPLSSVLLLLPRTDSVWQVVTVDPPLPAMNNVCAVGVVSPSGKQWVFALGETCTSYPTLRLFRLTVQSSTATAVAREITISFSATPYRCSGGTMHYADGYLYVLGGCYSGKQRNDHGKAVLFKDPARLLIGDVGNDAENQPHQLSTNNASLCNEGGTNENNEEEDEV